MITRLAPPSRWAAAFSRAVKSPVDSITTSTPCSFHGISAGSLTSSFLTSWPSTENPSSVALTSLRQRAADGVVLEEERHGGAVAEGVVHRDQLDAGGVAPVEQGPVEGPADPPEPVDPHSYRHLYGLLDSICRTTAEPAGPSPISPDRAPTRRGGGDIDRHRLDTPCSDRGLVGRQRAVSLVEEGVDPPAVLEHRPKMVGRVEPVGLRRLGPQVGRPAPPGRWCSATASADRADAQHRQQARVQRSRGEHDLVGGSDRGDRRPGWRRRRRAPGSPCGCDRRCSPPPPGPRPPPPRRRP